MSALTESDIVNNAYYLLEQDKDVWASTDDEWTVARGILNIGVGRWEFYENTTWRELWTTNSGAASSLGGDTVTTDSENDYDCPSDMARPGGYVVTSSSSATGTRTFWQVVPPEEVIKWRNSDDYYCYFTGNIKAGFDLHFNPRIDIDAGLYIDYPYYKQATKSTATSSTVEVPDPYFLSYFIAAHMAEGGVDPDMMDMAEARLEQMREVNLSSYWGVPGNIEDDGNTAGLGFGVST
jgi:hypothetical protein